MPSKQSVTWCRNCGHDVHLHCQEGLFSAQDACTHRSCSCTGFVGPWEATQ